jgi:cysteine-rich repeat protein
MKATGSVLATALLLAASAAATDVPLPARRVLITNGPLPGDAARRTISWLVTDPGVVAPLTGSAGDPRCVAAGGSGGGGTLRVFSDGAAGSTQDTGDIALPCAHWALIGTTGRPHGYVYHDRDHADGPCERVVVRDGRRLQARCTGRTVPVAYGLVVGRSENDVATALVFGATRQCTLVTAPSGKDGSDGKVFRATNAPAPAECASVTTTTTSTTTTSTTTTTIPPNCGNGVLDPGEDCDDGNNDAGDACSPACTFETLCLLTNNPGAPATSSLVKIARDGTLSSGGTVTLPGTNEVNGHYTAALHGRDVYLLLTVVGSSQIAGFDVGLDGTLTPLPTLTGLFRPFAIVSPAATAVLFTLEDYGLSGGRVGSWLIGAGGALSPGTYLSPVGGSFMNNMYADFHPLTHELWVAATFNQPIISTDGVTLYRIGYDAAGNMGSAQFLSLAPGLGLPVRVRDLRFTADAGTVALPGFDNGGGSCFAYWPSPGSTIPPLASLQQTCGTPFPTDYAGMVVRPEGGPLFYYQSGSTLDAAEFLSPSGIVSHSSITPVHATSQLLLAHDGRLLVSISQGAGEAATYDIASDLVTITPNDTLSLGAGPASAVLLPCPGA